MFAEPALLSPEQIILVILEHEKSVKKGVLIRVKGICPKCSRYCKCFKRHDSYSRIFFVIKDAIVITVISLLARAKCSRCLSTFVDYPDFAIPYKRYVIFDITQLLLLYLTDEMPSYERSVTVNEHSIEHEGSKSCLHHTTVYRWMTSISSIPQATDQAIDQIEKQNPKNPTVTYQPVIHPKKYKSTERKNILENAFQFILTFYEFIKIFGYSFFPYPSIGGIFPVLLLPIDNVFFPQFDPFIKNSFFPYLAILTAFT